MIDPISRFEFELTDLYVSIESSFAVKIINRVKIAIHRHVTES